MLILGCSQPWNNQYLEQSDLGVLGRGNGSHEQWLKSDEGRQEPSRQEMVIALITETVRKVSNVLILSMFSRKQHSYSDCA